jgi:hypothetical protein
MSANFASHALSLFLSSKNRKEHGSNNYGLLCLTVDFVCYFCEGRTVLDGGAMKKWPGVKKWQQLRFVVLCCVWWPFVCVDRVCSILISVCCLPVFAACYQAIRIKTEQAAVDTKLKDANFDDLLSALKSGDCLSPARRTINHVGGPSRRTRPPRVTRMMSMVAPTGTTKPPSKEVLVPGSSAM